MREIISGACPAFPACKQSPSCSELYRITALSSIWQLAKHIVHRHVHPVALGLDDQHAQRQIVHLPAQPQPDARVLAVQQLVH